EAIPALVRLLDDESFGRSAAAALSFFGVAARDAVPALIKALSSQHQSVLLIADALGSIGVEAKVAIPALVSELRDSSTDCKDENDLLAVIRALSDIDPDGEPTVSALVSLLTDIERPSSMYRFPVDTTRIQVELCRVLG